MADISYLQAVSVGLLQGVTELFPVSSLGHSVLVPAWIGGSWRHLVSESAGHDSSQSPYLAFVVALHVATALALLFHYRADWVRIVRAAVQVATTRRVRTSTERLTVLLVIGTIPVGILGLVLEKAFRTVFAKPEAAAVFLTLNGLILLAGEHLRRRERTRALDDLRPAEAAGIGLFQSLALLAGISRSGVTLVGGLVRGLDHDDAARFAFLLATPVILAAGVLKLPTLAGSAGHGIHGQVVVGSLAAGAAAYASVVFLTKWFHTRTMNPFAVYCLVAGIASAIHFA
jgi:undecaprenyl-diphosphatase